MKEQLDKYRIDVVAHQVRWKGTVIVDSGRYFVFFNGNGTHTKDDAKQNKKEILEETGHSLERKEEAGLGRDNKMMARRMGETGIRIEQDRDCC